MKKYDEQIGAIESKTEFLQQISVKPDMQINALAAPSDSDLVFQYDDSGNQIRREVIKVN
ncbi:hypothetical protein HS960_14550 [Sphingobacterium paramultivorum]|uniref:Uncharacterized protein n=1 Tax=Sphingobacterium paramultivorum TaxID=2886510 RepID=A0A7G5E475_9SPHI|nr:hypothetical protein [Sphingobacterium paramultivorum]QMV68800.1 hypothetical protein HS960_14550 [Sphingobacterium paramultivorum]WSO12566.1 hypothetical protein VUL84_14540 [Sphingobacterium paramultivorum]